LLKLLKSIVLQITVALRTEYLCNTYYFVNMNIFVKTHTIMTAILSSITISVDIPTRHICTVRTIDSFDTGESQRSKCPRVKDRP